MAQRLWSIGLAGLGFGSLAMVGGTVVKGDLGPLVAGYGLLVALSAAYLLVGLAIRGRVWHRVTRLARDTSHVESVAGRRVF